MPWRTRFFKAAPPPKWTLSVFKRGNLTWTGERIHSSKYSSTKWALNVFELWKQARNKHHPEDPVPADLLVTCDPVLLNTHLSKFAVEARKANGEIYPPGTIHQLLCGLLRHMQETTPGCPNFLNKQDSNFCDLQGTLDALFHKLHSDSIGVRVRHTEIITKADENKLWASGVMGVCNPRSLQNAAFFVVVIHLTINTLSKKRWTFHSLCQPQQPTASNFTFQNLQLHDQHNSCPLTA